MHGERGLAVGEREVDKSKNGFQWISVSQRFENSSVKKVGRQKHGRYQRLS